MADPANDSIMSWSKESLVRKPLILDPKKQMKFKQNIQRMLNINPTREEVSDLEKEFKREQKANILIKRLQNFKAVISVLKKTRNERSKMEIKALASFLCEHYNFFKKIKEESDNDKIESCINALNLEIFQKNDKIIKYGEEGRKFYIILDGLVGVYKPRFVEKEMSLKDFVIHLTFIKYKERDEYKLRRTEEANMRTANIQLIKLFNYDFDRLIEINTVKHYYIEEYEVLCEKKEGDEFGEVALLQKAPRNATIIAHNECYIASLEKYDYNHIIRKLEEKKFNATINDFRMGYRMLKTWNKALIIKLMASFATINLGYGETLYEQNTHADYIYFTKSGTFEFYTLVSLANYEKFEEYVHNTKGSLILHLIKYGKINENELENLKANGEKLNGKFNLHTKSDINFNFKLQSKKQNLVDLKLKEEELKQGHGLFPVKVRTIEFKDILGIEEALEIKSRFYTIKCISQTAEIFKIKLDDFIILINLAEVDKHAICSFITERKEVLIKQLKNSVYIKMREKDRKIEHQYNKFLLDLKEEKEKNKSVSPIGLKIINKEVYKSMDNAVAVQKENVENLKQKLPFKPNRTSYEFNMFDKYKTDTKSNKSRNDISSESMSIITPIPNGRKSSGRTSFIRKLAESSNGINQGERRSRVSSIFKNWSIFRELDLDGNIPAALNKAIRNHQTFDSNLYRKKIENKNFDEMKKEITKLIGSNFKSHTRKRNLLAKTFDNKLFSISAISDIKTTRTNKFRLVNAPKVCNKETKEDKLITTEEDSVETKFKPDERLIKSCSSGFRKCEKETGDITFRNKGIINLKKSNDNYRLVLKSVEKKAQSVQNKSKSGCVSMEIKMKYFKNLKQRKMLIAQKNL